MFELAEQVLGPIQQVQRQIVQTLGQRRRVGTGPGRDAAVSGLGEERCRPRCRCHAERKPIAEIDGTLAYPREYLGEPAVQLQRGTDFDHHCVGLDHYAGAELIRPGRQVLQRLRLGGLVPGVCDQLPGECARGRERHADTDAGFTRGRIGAQHHGARGRSMGDDRGAGCADATLGELQGQFGDVKGNPDHGGSSVGA